MTHRAQRGSRVIYVAASAAEFPEEVRLWLAQPALRATPCPNVYDALASLASAKPPACILVSLQSIDWGELDFFTHLHRLCPDTLVQVAGGDADREKLEAAIARGARVFEAEAFDELLAATPEPPPHVGPAGLLAGSLRTDLQVPEPTPRLAPAEPPPAAPSAPPPPEAERPPVRLVSSAEPEDEEPTVPFPWSPAANRPQRTPPRPTAGSDAAAEPRRRPPIKLTPEELSALLEPHPDAGQVQEGGT